MATNPTISPEITIKYLLQLDCKPWTNYGHDRIYIPEALIRRTAGEEYLASDPSIKYFYDRKKNKYYCSGAYTHAGTIFEAIEKHITDLHYKDNPKAPDTFETKTITAALGL